MRATDLLCVWSAKYRSESQREKFGDATYDIEEVVAVLREAKWPENAFAALRLIHSQGIGQADAVRQVISAAEEETKRQLKKQMYSNSVEEPQQKSPKKA